MLEVRIAKKFSDFSLKVDFEVADQIVVLFGPSGCGKTTILRCIAGLTRPDSGKIALDERIFFDSAAKEYVPPKDRGVGYVFQEYALFPHMTVEKNIVYGVKHFDEETYEHLQSLKQLLKIEELMGRYPMELSGGEQQRVALARALMAGPRILLLDEPLSALDSEIRLELQEELIKLQRLWKIPFIVVTHDRAEAEKIGDCMVYLKQGRVTTTKNFTVPRI